MNKKNEALKVAAVGDLHAKENSQGSFRDLFSQASHEADILLLCGDLTDLGLPQQAKSLAHDLSHSSIPVLGILGNHDCESGKAEEIKNILQDAGMIFLEDDVYELSGVGFAGAKGFGGGFDKYMLSSFGEPATKNFVAEAVNESLRLENHLRSLDTKKIVAVLHYSPVLDTVKGESLEIFPFLGCSRLAETIDRFEVNAVFHGHAHHGTFEGKTHKGIPVYNCCLNIVQKRFNKPYALIEI